MILNKHASNLQKETSFYAAVLGLICEMEGGKKLIQRLFIETYVAFEESDPNNAQAFIEYLEKNIGEKMDFGNTGPFFKKVTERISKKFKMFVISNFKSEKTWAQEKKIEMNGK